MVVALGAAGDVAKTGTPAEGVPLEVRRGFFTETDLGIFTNFGGQDSYSNVTPYLQLGIGYDIGAHFELGFHVGIGSSAQNCYGAKDAKLACVVPTDSKTSLPDNFTVTYFSLTAAYLFEMVERFYIAPKLIGGFTILDPAPVVDANKNPIRFGANVGLAVGLEYATNMDHFSIGADVAFRYIIGPNIPSFQFLPRVKYTF